jgi:hypothetical protein
MLRAALTSTSRSVWCRCPRVMAPYACATVMAAKRMPVVIRYGFMNGRWVKCVTAA